MNPAKKSSQRGLRLPLAFHPWREQAVKTFELANKGFDEDAGAEEGLSQVDAGTSQESN